jgi:hypothetical protein
MIILIQSGTVVRKATMVYGLLVDSIGNRSHKLVDQSINLAFDNMNTGYAEVSTIHTLDFLFLLWLP